MSNTLLNNRYQLISLIGEGGTSTVYKAIDHKNNNINNTNKNNINNINNNKKELKTVAIKILNFNKKNYTLFKNEVESLKNLHNKNYNNYIIKYYDSFQYKNLLIIVLDYIPNILTDLINKSINTNTNILNTNTNILNNSILNNNKLKNNIRNNIDIRKSLKIIRMLLIAVYNIHKEGYIHRDIKLSNILVNNKEIILCDFGLCVKTLNNKYNINNNYNIDSNINNNYSNINKLNNNNYNKLLLNGYRTTFCGTEEYLAPEMLKSNSNLLYNNKIDIYAVGLIFYILLTGRRYNNKLSNSINILNNSNINKNIVNIDIIKNLLKLLLEENPSNRISASDALKHPAFYIFYPINYNFNNLYINYIDRIPDFKKFINTSNKLLNNTNNYILNNIFITKKGNIINFIDITIKFNKNNNLLYLNNNLIDLYYIDFYNLKKIEFIYKYLYNISKKIDLINISNNTVNINSNINTNLLSNSNLSNLIEYKFNMKLSGDFIYEDNNNYKIIYKSNLTNLNSNTLLSNTILNKDNILSNTNLNILKNILDNLIIYYKDNILNNNKLPIYIKNILNKLIHNILINNITNLNNTNISNISKLNNISNIDSIDKLNNIDNITNISNLNTFKSNSLFFPTTNNNLIFYYNKINNIDIWLIKKNININNTKYINNINNTIDINNIDNINNLEYNFIIKNIRINIIKFNINFIDNLNNININNNILDCIELLRKCVNLLDILIEERSFNIL